MPDNSWRNLKTGESPVPELSLDAVHVEGDPVKVQALVQPGSDLKWGFTMKKYALHSFHSTRLMSHKARGSSRLKRYLRWAFLTNFCEEKTYMSSSPWQTPGSVMFAFFALSEKRAWKALLSGEAYSREYLKRNTLFCLQPDKNHRCPFVPRQGQFGQRFYQKAWEPWSALSVTNS